VVNVCDNRDISDILHDLRFSSRKGREKRWDQGYLPVKFLSGKKILLGNVISSCDDYS
jgi:hypothetical protein